MITCMYSSIHWLIYFVLNRNPISEICQGMPTNLSTVGLGIGANSISVDERYETLVEQLVRQME